MTASDNRGASSRWRNLGREAVWIGLGQVAVALGALVGVRILTELLPPAAYGELALALTLATLVNQILMGPLSAAATRFYSIADAQADIRSYLGGLRGLLLGATVLVALFGVVIVLCAAWVGSRLWEGLVTATLLFAVLSGYNAILGGIQNAARQRVIVALHQGAASFGRFLMAAALILLFGASSPVAMAGYAIGMVLVLASQGFFFRRVIVGAAARVKEGSAPDRWQSRMFSYAWPFAAFGVFTWGHLVSDRWALDLFASTAEVGLFAALYQLGYYPVNLATNVLTQVVWPILFKRAGDATDAEQMKKIHRLTSRLALGIAGLTLVVFVVATQVHVAVFSIFAAREYAAVSPLLPWMLLAGGLYATGQVISLRYEIWLKTRALSSIKIATAGCGIAANLAGAKMFGLNGVVAASVAFSSLYVAVLLFFSERSFRLVGAVPRSA